MFKLNQSKLNEYLLLYWRVHLEQLSHGQIIIEMFVDLVNVIFC